MTQDESFTYEAKLVDQITTDIDAIYDHFKTQFNEKIMKCKTNYLKHIQERERAMNANKSNSAHTKVGVIQEHSELQNPENIVEPVENKLTGM